ncbi:hypothetical protein SAMN05216567_107337 [Variovorax sp. OK605]|jgi:hypothetical protein|uniref:hypothetical protein n=1 Tax=unclassified Variovorax TaxID=663243 RepID=UPI0008BA6BAF|nr:MULTISPECIES: hypothetical protein [unclassified Variovorax]SEK16296.1 hypothetical protein SAMN05518853_12410 [Variovorax sp. OK202]SFE40341.1 hypothetical protein SAMN05444746_12375 [Variovorax sp. OK212]SFP62711.1 hypothetical protein SAMN05216567_107337 [Variovorax sp. OK605]
MRSPLLLALSAAALAATLTGCVVAPAQPVYAAPPGVAYVAPTYVSPGVGFVWAYHPRFGWGWRHPQSGWHRGWR